MTKRTVFTFAGVGAAMFAMLGLAGVLNSGFDSRLTTEQRKIAAFAEYDKESLYRYGECFKTTDSGPVTGFSPTCVHPGTTDRVNLLWGDSHAAALSHGLSQHLDGFAFFAVASCAPLLPGTLGLNERCWPASTYVLNQVERLKPARIFLHARWNRESGIDMPLALGRCIDRLKELSPNSMIYVIGSVPQWKPNLPRILLLKKVALEHFAMVQSPHLSELRQIDDELRTTVATSKWVESVRFISVIDSICSDSDCAAVVPLGNEFQPLAFDFGHLTEGGTLYVGNAIADQMAVSSGHQSSTVREDSAALRTSAMGRSEPFRDGQHWLSLVGSFRVDGGRRPLTPR